MPVADPRGPQSKLVPAMAVINIIGLYFLAPVVKRELNSFLEFVRTRKAGEMGEVDEDQEPVKTTV
ncbi:hypothetical protein [Streptomyces jeddahensis]|uniref:Uncharacterized protein n=1 Tax=Streptomyces jeddahensis TaxID=1716141 RepID=A0A177HJ05_9ACTN|nr:hypothetical protein [Streptomyces jeddahensis]OAH10387.1 hypothetical protein STSP_62860 [Streptomyces jeddahensis]